MINPTQARQLRDAIRHLVVAHGVLNASRRPCGAPLSVPHAYALVELLQAAQGLTTTELAAKLSIDRTNVSRLIARMESAGEVKRRTDSTDGRARPVTLTARGRRLAEGVDESSAMHVGELGDSLGMPVNTVIECLRSLEVAMTRGSSGAEQEDA